MRRQFCRFVFAGIAVIKNNRILSATRGFLGLNGSLLTHGSKDDNVGILLIGDEKLGDLVGNLTLGHLNVVLGVAIVAHERQETVIRDIEKLILAAGDVGDIHIVGGGAEILVLLAGEDIDGDEMDLGVTVLASLRGRHVDDLARATLDDDVTVLPQRRTLHREGERSASIDGVESVLMLGVIGHGCGKWKDRNLRLFG
jgi:hypothetical protein